MSRPVEIGIDKKSLPDLKSLSLRIPIQTPFLICNYTWSLGLLPRSLKALILSITL
jgi:hypothetical protein